MKKEAMGKKGQMAAFIIIGIVLLIGISAASYLMYLSRQAPLEQGIAEQLPEKLDKLSLDALITACIKKTANPLLVKIAKFGGTINPQPSNYKFYNNTRYRYLCEQFPGYSKCVNKLLTRESMQDELQRKITADVAACVSPALQFYKDRGYSVESGDVGAKVIIGTDDVNVLVNYPLVISSEESKITVSDYSVRFDYPLGKLYDLAMTIINDENSQGYFNQEKWMFNHGAEILIQKHRPYPDIMYRISKFNWQKLEWYIFNFALQSRDRLPELAGVGSLGTTGQIIAPATAAQSTAFDQDIGCCYNSNDGNCFEDGDKNTCSEKGLEWKSGACENKFTCKSLSEDKYDNSTLCNGVKCRDCMDPTYRSGDNPNDPSTFTGPGKRHGESWCEYEGPTGRGEDFVGSRHYKHICIDGIVLVEECRDFRDELCAEETVEKDGKQMSSAVCRPNRWQDCHLYSNDQAACNDKTKRDCFWSTMQNNFVIGPPSDQAPYPSTPYEQRHCVPAVAPGFRFWNTLEGMQVCGWANNYYECDIPGCFQEWFDFDAAFCSFQGDCGIARNYLGKMPSSPADSLFPGASQLAFVAPEAQIMGTGFTSMPNPVTPDLFELVLPNGDSANGLIPRKDISLLPAYPQQRKQTGITQEMFIHNSPNDYSLLGIMSFVQGMAQWGISRINNIEDDVWNYLVHKDPIDWSTAGVSVCNVWGPAASASDCDECNNNPYRPCTEYRCRSLGMFCNYEEINGVGVCSSFGTSIIGKPVVKFDEQITEGYDLKSATLSSVSDVYVGKEIKEPIQSDYTFQVKTNRETQCRLVLLPGTSFGLSPSFPGTTADYSFSAVHNLTIPYLSADSLSVITLPLELMSLIDFNPDQLWAVFSGMSNQIINFIEDIADDCHDCNPLSLDCSDAKLIFLSKSDCDEMDDTKNQVQAMTNSISDLWNKELKIQIDAWLGAAKENAVDEILNYASSQNKYHAFVKCRDRGGNENENDLDFIRFKVSPTPLPPVTFEDTAPVITAISPQNWTEQSPESDGTIQLFVFVDQLAECAYGPADAEFIYMENKLECPASTYEGGLGGTYLCNASVPFTAITDPAAPQYIKCIDHPEHYETFNFRLEPGESFSGPSRTFWVAPENEGEPGAVIVKNPVKLNASMPVITVPTTSVKFFMEFKDIKNDQEKALECRYATSPDQIEIASTMFVDPMTGSNECDNCTALLTATGTDYFVSCHFMNDKRNVGSAMQYVLQTATSQ